METRILISKALSSILSAYATGPSGHNMGYFGTYSQSATDATAASSVDYIMGGRANGGPVAGGSLYEVAEGGKPEVLSSGGHTYLLMGAQDGYVTPASTSGTSPLSRASSAGIAQTKGGDVIVNVQGDLPLLDPAMIENAVAPLITDPTLQIGTLCTPIVDDADYRNPNVVKVVRNGRGDALYFSRAPIPHVRNPDVTSRAAFKHIGLYAYRRAFVPTFAALPPSPLELAESLEQLRALEHGYRIHVVLTNVESIEVDTPEDLERVRRLVAVGART